VAATNHEAIMIPVIFVILVRNPNGNRIIAIDTGEGDDPPIATFSSVEEAEDAAARTPVCRAWPWTVVEAP
jgi:hypothetical protein